MMGGKCAFMNTGSRMLFFLSWILLVLFSAGRVQGQEIQFTGSARSTVAVGETFTLTYTLNAQGVGFRGPNIQGFEVLSGPNTSTSSSIRSINGRTSMTITYTYTYLLQATREGSFDIPAASVSVDRKTYTSNTLNIKVVKNASGSSGVSGHGSGGAQGSRNAAESGAGSIGAGDVYVKAFASNANPLQGEGIVVTYKIFTKVPIAQINISKLSSFSGFWSQNLMKENDKLQQTTQVINGEQYVVADIRKIALFPLKSGRLVIDPLELECIAQVRKQTRTRTGDPFFDDFFNDSFFSSNIANVEKNLKSPILFGGGHLNFDLLLLYFLHRLFLIVFQRLKHPFGIFLADLFLILWRFLLLFVVVLVFVLILFILLILFIVLLVLVVLILLLLLFLQHHFGIFEIVLGIDILRVGHQGIFVSQDALLILLRLKVRVAQVVVNL